MTKLGLSDCKCDVTHGTGHLTSHFVLFHSAVGKGVSLPLYTRQCSLNVNFLRGETIPNPTLSHAKTYEVSIFNPHAILTFLQLRDIFTVHPNTACHTHDLLECPCSTGSSGYTGSTVEGARDNDWDAQAENATGEDGEKEMGFISASAMDPAKFDRMDQEVCHSRSPRRSCQCSIHM